MSSESSDNDGCLWVIVAIIIFYFWPGGDPNDKPEYGKSSGLPANCRAYVQVVVDDYRNKRYSANDAMAGLERNCGINGHLWGKQE